MKKTPYILTGILTASISVAIASPPPPPLPPAPAPTGLIVQSFQNSGFVGLHPNSPGARPDNAADRLNGSGINSAVDQFSEASTSAGVAAKSVTPRSPNNVFSLSGEYDYIYTGDSRFLGSDMNTHSVSILGSAFLGGNTFLSLGYSYNNATSGVNGLGSSSHSDGHFISLVVARTFGFLSVGVAGGYGNTDYKINVRPVPVKTNATMDTWTVSPFVSASYRSGRLTSSLTVAYEYETDHTSSPGFANNDDTGKLTVALRETYAASEKVKLQAFAKFTEVLNGLGQTPGLPQSRAWATFGARVSYFVSRPVELYAGYAYDAFNQYLDTHTATVGLRYSF